MKTLKTIEDYKKENAELKLENEIVNKRCSELLAKSPISQQLLHYLPGAVCMSRLEGYGADEYLCHVYSNPGLRRLLNYSITKFHALGDNFFPAIIDKKDHHCIAETIEFLKLNPRLPYLSACRMLTSRGEVLPSVIISFVLSRHLNSRINQILSVGIPLHIYLHNEEVIIDMIKQQKQMEHKDIVGKLTERQKEVIQLRVNGYSEKETAEKLCISHKTVKSHCQEIRSLLNVHNLLQLIRLAVTCGLN